MQSDISVLFCNPTWDTKNVSDRWVDPHLQAQSCHSRTHLDKHNTAHAAILEMLPPRQNINRHYRPFLWDYAYTASMIGCPDALSTVSLSAFAVWRHFGDAVISAMAC